MIIYYTSYRHKDKVKPANLDIILPIAYPHGYQQRYSTLLTRSSIEAGSKQYLT